MTHGILHFGTANDKASNLRLKVNTTTYVGTEGVTVGVDTTAPVLNMRAYTTNRPGVGPAYVGNFAEGSTVDEESSGTQYRQVTAGSGSRWIIKRSERLPGEGQPAFQGDRHTNPFPLAGAASGLVCINDGVSAQRPFPLSTAVVQGDFYSANGKTYYVATGGTTSATAPSHSSGTVVNGTASLTWYGANAVYKSESLISS
jgi:hypothetical protein